MTVTHYSHAALAIAYARRHDVELRLPTWMLSKPEGAPVAGLAGQQRRAPAQGRASA